MQFGLVRAVLCSMGRSGSVQAYLWSGSGSVRDYSYVVRIGPGRSAVRGGLGWPGWSELVGLVGVVQ